MCVQTAWQLHTVQTKWPKIFSAFFILFQVLKRKNEWEDLQVTEYNIETSELHTCLCTASSTSPHAPSSLTYLLSHVAFSSFLLKITKINKANQTVDELLI